MSKGRDFSIELRNEILDIMDEHIETELNKVRVLLTDDDLKNINSYLGSYLSTSRDKKLVFNQDGFTLRINVRQDTGTRSKVILLDRTKIAESQTRDLVDRLDDTASVIENQDSIKDLLGAYVNTYLAIEDGMKELIYDLIDMGKAAHPEVMRTINSSEVYFDYGGFRVAPTIEFKEDSGKISWSARYEALPEVKLSIKNDFSY